MFYRQIAIDAIEKAIAAANSSGMLDHPVLKGRLREIVVEELVKPFLNPHIKAATGMIVDAFGNQSGQIDVILYDEQITPPILFTEGEGVIPCHSVVATIEVKSTLTREKLRNAVDNARSVKLLKYDYDKIPLSPEAGLRLGLYLELLNQLPNGITKDALKRALTTISSPACYTFAFKSDLAKEGAVKDELSRLIEVVDESNKANQLIKVPISGLCVADQSFVFCHSVEPTPEFTIKHSDDIGEKQSREGASRYWASHNVVLEFISHLANTCNTYASQRSRIPLNVYFKPLSGVND